MACLYLNHPISINLLNKTYRSNMFIKELHMYVDYFKKEVMKVAIKPTANQIAYFNEFKTNLMDGIEYSRELFPQMIEEAEEYRQRALDELAQFKENVEQFIAQHANIFDGHPPSLSPATAEPTRT